VKRKSNKTQLLFTFTFLWGKKIKMDQERYEVLTVAFSGFTSPGTGAVLLGEWLPTFRKNVVPSSS
jgi:hypothetical protein